MRAAADSAVPGWPGNFKITIVGLGLMGGSFARALASAGPAAIWAVDRDRDVLRKARDEGVITEGYTDPAVPLAQSDLVIICLYPGDTIHFLNTHRHLFKKGAVVTDICGVKTPVVESVDSFEGSGVDFVPGHPMAGRERQGYGESKADLFAGCSYILTPLPENRPRSIDLIKAMAGTLGAARIVTTDSRTHDEYISFTSQIPHILAVAYMQASQERDLVQYAGGSFRDVSRVALINEVIWSELFIRNRDKLVPEIRELIRRLNGLADSVENQDAPALMEALRDARQIKEEYDAAARR